MNTPLQALLALLDADGTTPLPALLAKTQLDGISADLLPILAALKVADMTPDKLSRLSGRSVVDVIAILNELADALPSCPQLQTALGLQPADVKALVDLLVKQGGLAHAFAALYEGADNGVLLCAQQQDSDVAAALGAAAAIAAPGSGVAQATRQEVLNVFSAPAKEFAQAVATAASSEPGPSVTEAQQAVDNKTLIQEFLAAVRSGQVQITAPSSAPAPATTKAAKTPKAPKTPTVH